MTRGLRSLLSAGAMIAGGAGLLAWSLFGAAAGPSILTVARDSVIPANDGRLVHVSGPVKIERPPRDPDTGVGGDGLRLMRRVEMHQWRETPAGYGGEWSAVPVDSARFREPQGHANPPFPLRDEAFDAQGVTIGAFRIDAARLAGAGAAEALRIAPEAAPAIAARLRLDRTLRALDGVLLASASSTAATVGDLRISYAMVRMSAASVVAAQRDGGFAPWRAPSGEAIFAARSGDVEARFITAGLAARAPTPVSTWAMLGASLLMLAAGAAALWRVHSAP